MSGSISVQRSLFFKKKSQLLSNSARELRYKHCFNAHHQMVWWMAGWKREAFAVRSEQCIEKVSDCRIKDDLDLWKRFIEMFRELIETDCAA